MSKAIGVLAWLSCGYGVRPSYAVVWALLTILAFALIFWTGDGIRRSAKPLSEPAGQVGVQEHVTFRNALFFSTMIFLSRGPSTSCLWASTGIMSSWKGSLAGCCWLSSW